MSKLEGINPGDRVRVMFEAVVSDEGDWPLELLIAEGCGVTPFEKGDIEADTFHIERIDPPLKVGDRVRPKGQTPLSEGVVLAVDGDDVFLRGVSGAAYVSKDFGLEIIP